MSLYDKASLVLIPSGTKAGTVFSQKPVPRELSSELVTNGGFDTDSDWGKNNGITISDGKSNFTGLSGQYLSQEINISSGKIYKIDFTVLSGSGVLTIFLGAANNIYSQSDYNIGQNTIYATAEGLDSKIYFGSLFTGSIDNISVKEVDIEPADFDFTRSTYATRVNSQGLIEKERSNLLLQSNNFDTTWEEQNGGDLTSGQSDKDGGTTAWKLESTSGTTGARIQQTISNSGVATYSIYAKAGTSDWLATYCEAGANSVYVYYDLANGVVGTSIGNNDITIDIEDCGSGWYRCIATFNQSITQVRNYIANANGNIATSVGDNIYIQDAQLEQGLVATDYIETTTSAVYEGITDNVPRLDYDGDCPSLLLEPQRSNLIDSAEYYNGSSWSRVRSTITDNAETSPEGVDNASALIATAVNDDHYIYATPATTNAIHTYSVFLKKGNRTWARLWETTTNVFVDFNLDTGATGTTNGTIIDKGTEDFGNGWYRCYFTYDTGSAGLKVCRIYSLEGDNDRSYLGDGTTEEIYIYGAQLEEGSYATSYIPTYGTSVTRNADLCNNAGDSTVFNSQEGVLYGEINPIAIKDQSGYFGLLGTNTANRVILGFPLNSNDVTFFVVSQGTTLANGSYDIGDMNQYIKVALKYKENDFALWINGSEVVTRSSGTPNVEISHLGFYGYGTSQPLFAKCKAVAYFNRALTDTELADLTT